MENPFEMPQRGRKKADYAALSSPLARIPGIDVKTVRDLIDVGFGHVDELRGRSPEVIFGQICDHKPGTPKERLFALRLAVYYAENSDPDPAKLEIWAWQD